MDSDSEKENYFSIYMKRKKNDNKKKHNFLSNKKPKNSCASIQKLKEDNKKKIKLLLESSEKKNKNTFSFIKSYLFNFQDPDKKAYGPGVKNLVIDKQKIKNVRVNKSSTDINRKINKNKSNNKYNNDIGYENKLNSNKKNNYNNNNYDNKIEKLKSRIFNLMNIIDNFEKDYINNNKPIHIKEQLNKINLKIISNNIQNNNKYNKNNKNIINGQLYVTDRTNYNQNKKLKSNNKKDFIKLGEDLDICNYYDYDYENKILTKRTNSNKKNQEQSALKL